MPYFKCTLVDEQGHFQTREQYAESRRELVASLSGLDEKLVAVRRLWWRDVSLRRIFRRRIGTIEFLLFNQEMITLLKSGIPLIRALEIIVQNTPFGVLREVLAKAAGNIRNGMQVSEAFASPQIPYVTIYRASLTAGERSGHLEQVLEKFNVYLGKINNLRRRMIGGLTYPIILLTFMVAVILVIAVFVIPRFSSFFADMDAPLPPLTLFFMDVTRFLRANLLPILAALLLAYFAVRGIERLNPRVVVIDRLKLRAPFLGRIAHENAIAVFARTLAILISGGIPVPESTELAVATFANRFHRLQVLEVADKIRQGNLLSAVLEEVPMMPRILVEMVRVGETSGNLSAVLDESAEYYERSLDNRISTLISLIEPVIIIGLGVVIAVMLLSVYLPIFSIVKVVQ